MLHLYAEYTLLTIISCNVIIFYLEDYITFVLRRHLITDCLHILQTFMPSLTLFTSSKVLFEVCTQTAIKVPGMAVD
jgi:hypothetical protein